jgi:hypothetical protein
MCRVDFCRVALLIAILCGLPFVFSIPNLQGYMNQRPDWVGHVPPFWFLGVDQAILGRREPFVLDLARSGVPATLAAALAAVGTYVWSYRRHKVRLLETPFHAQKAWRLLDRWSAAMGEWVMPDPRARAVFSFIGKSLSRSRSHRMVLTTFAGLAIALIFESFVTLALAPGFRGFGVRTFALRQASISAPLALSLFVLAGYRYLFRLPVELNGELGV